MAHERDPIPTRLSLVEGMRDLQNQERWAVFYETYSPLIRGVARKAGLSDAEADDIVQETVISVARQMPGFKYDPAIGSFKSWLLLITKRRIVDHFRRRQRSPLSVLSGAEEGNRTPLVERIPEPAGPEIDRLWESEWQNAVSERALALVKRRVNPRQFQIFDCYVLKQWPVEQVVRTLGVSNGQVYLARTRISKLLQEQVRALEGGMV